MKRATEILTAERLKELLRYDQNTGVFVRLGAKQNGPTKIGSPAGTHNTFGYLQIFVVGKLHLAHRLAWLYVTGDWPDGPLDHINRVRDDNRFHNLRQVTHASNMQNKGRYKNNSTGVVGVYQVRNGVFAASIGVGGASTHIGTFYSFEDAVAARQAAQQKYHPLHGPEAYV